MEGENGRSLLGERACTGNICEQHAGKKAQMREQWGLEEELLDVMGSGGAAELNSKYVISQEPEGIGRLHCGLR